MARVALVTGGMGGLGETISIKMVDAGYKVAVTYSPGNKTHAEWVAQMAANGYAILAVPCDVADFASCGRAVAAVHRVATGGGQPAAVLHEEAARAGELVLLLGQHADGELLVGQVGTRELEGLGRLGLVLVDLAGVLVVPASLELLDALLAGLVVGLARSVVVSSHAGSLPWRWGIPARVSV